VYQETSTINTSNLTSMVAISSEIQELLMVSKEVLELQE
jgi:hypothetical protein